MIMLILVALSGGLWLLQSIATSEGIEPFMSDRTFASQRNFINNNIAKASIGDASMDVFGPKPNPEDLKKALEDIDLFAQRQRPETENYHSNTFGSAMLERERQCRALARAEDLPDDAVKQRLDCAWMFGKDSKSGGALCSLAGPVFSKSRADFPTTQFEFTWSKTEAVRKERMKECAKITMCDLTVPNSGCGYCPELGKGVPVAPNGQSLYDEARCPYNPVTRPERCFFPRSEGGAGQATATCTPDSQGRLSKSCLAALSSQAGCNDAGTILQALRSPTSADISSQQVREAAEVMRSFNHSIPQGILADGRIGVDTALNSYIGISQAVNASPQGRVRKAAGNLCYGTPFDACDYDNESKEAFNLDCLQRLFLNVGCQGRGTEFPREETRNKYYGRTWGAIKSEVNLIADMMTNSRRQYSVEEQKIAVRKCIGTALRRRKIGFCNELGISVKILDGTGRTFFGRKILTNQFFMLRPDSTLWDSLDLEELPTRGGQVLLLIETNFNPAVSALLSYLFVSNSDAILSWNDGQRAVTSVGGLTTRRIDGLQVAKDQQSNQKLKFFVNLRANQIQERSSIVYLSDSNNNLPSINMCRLPIERKSPLINIVMNQGGVEEITGNVQVIANNIQVGTRGGRSCTIFNGHSGYIQIPNGIRTKAFRSYTCKVWSNRAGNWSRFFQFYNGTHELRNEIAFWIFIPIFFWLWIPIPIYQLRWVYVSEDWEKSRDNVQFATGLRQPTIIAAFKQNQFQGHTIYAQKERALEYNKWQHWTWVWNEDWSSIDILLDGVRIMSGTGTPIQDNVTQENFIGKAFFDGTHSLHEGAMEWFRAFDYPLTADEIQQDMDDDW
jgi:hypothetical protein